MVPENYTHSIRLWLAEVQLEFLSELFEKAQINAKSILECTEETLVNIGILNPDHRQKILGKIQVEKRREKIINAFFIFIGLVQVSVLLMPIYKTTNRFFGIESVLKVIDFINNSLIDVDIITIFIFFQGIMLIKLKSKIIDLGINSEIFKYSKFLIVLFILSFFYISICGISIAYNRELKFLYGFYISTSISTLLLLYLIKNSFKFLLLPLIYPLNVASNKTDKNKEAEEMVEENSAPFDKSYLDKLERLIINDNIEGFYAQRNATPKLFADYKRELDYQESKWNELEKNFKQEIIDYQTYSVPKGKIRESLLSIIRKIRGSQFGED